uniref:Transmembrane protein n=1 Tax=Noctiluca scintillans TaxID=2966 RepID=A0A7S1F3Q1_NOCSC|mmetsp:Transcript_29675/g.78701  ORF Transcript_29675/g.78701 Transcript_29675/m.78701 type:complete len:603 (+) Transcript_29675:86-1894(+)|eukprot:CAMPEP_0194503264 /NCGR_PEP_ID=MMETSP0253-20130528/28283_1 /TAXON_ID=2966 /ORGANISM="Noctiluca scintillans" /LENGTH=602 /DNA_ID=CAMNT_0039345535 /DNA_START=83 /DNA_END=1891 /DNA_ORIENTATION=+
MIIFPSFVSLSFLIPVVFAGSGNFLTIGEVSRADAAEVLRVELGNRVDHEEHLQNLENTLKPIYTVLPKTSAGQLGHQAVRYLLHRHFVNANGWYIRGLEPNSDTSSEWMPSFLQESVERSHAQDGLTLREVAVLAASIEDLVHGEARARLQLAYTIHDLPLSDITFSQAQKALLTYYVAFLKAGNFAAESETEAQDIEQVFKNNYFGWQEAQEWMSKRLMAFGENDILSFPTVVQLAEGMGEDYHEFNDRECGSLKDTLVEIEENRPGRVPLSSFYKKSLHSHWGFVEKADYLRTIGALDESNPKRWQVIVPNYLHSSPNCLNSSHIYGICCRNECEDLMSHIETKVRSSEAGPAQIAQIVSFMSSASITAPRELTTELLTRLDQVAYTNQGAVPLHGRLFAQWMHNAFPRECPYPHTAGSVSPQTPDEWMQQTGHQATAASEEEMAAVVQAADTCVGVGCGGEADLPLSEALPWSDTEELLQPKVPFQSRRSTGEDGEEDSSLTVFAGLVAAILSIFLAVDLWMTRKPGMEHLKHEAFAEFDVSCGSAPQSEWQIPMALGGLAFIGHVFGLVNKSIVMIGVCCSLAVLSSQRVAKRLKKA